MPLHERESRHRADRMANRARTPVPKAHAGHVLRNHVPLYGPRSGWKLAGRDLISPDGLRLPEGSITERSRRHRGMAAFVRIPVRDWHLECF